MLRVGAFDGMAKRTKTKKQQQRKKKKKKKREGVNTVVIRVFAGQE